MSSVSPTVDVINVYFKMYSCYKVTSIATVLLLKTDQLFQVGKPTPPIILNPVVKGIEIKCQGSGDPRVLINLSQNHA